MRVAISAVIIEKGNILLVKKGEHWILPGGKPDKKESDLSCLVREIGEELNGTEISHTQFYGSFQGVTPHTRDVLENRVYLARINGKLYDASAEIKDRVLTDCPEQYQLSDITAKVINRLKQDRYIK